MEDEQYDSTIYKSGDTTVIVHIPRITKEERAKRIKEAERAISNIIGYDIGIYIA